MRSWALLAAGALSLACQSSDEGDAEGAAGSAQDDDCEGRGMLLAPGLSLAAADDIEVELVSLEPQLPVVGDNAWQVRVTRSGSPLEAAALSVLPWMPEHQHASTKAVQVSEVEAAVYQLEPLYLGMLGYWQIGVTLTLDGEPLGSVSFDTCLSREQ